MACIRSRFLKDMRCSSGEVAYSQLLCPYLISFLHGAAVSLSLCSAQTGHAWLGVHWAHNGSSEKEESLAECLKLFLCLCAEWGESGSREGCSSLGNSATLCHPRFIFLLFLLEVLKYNAQF